MKHIIILSIAAIGCSSLQSQTVQFPADPGIINIRNSPYFATGDGVADDTAAIQQAVKDHVGTHAILYFPNGTYRLTDSVVWKDNGGAWQNALTLQGESKMGVRLKLPDNRPGFTDVLAPKALIVTGSDNPNNVATGEGNQAFRNNIKDMTIDTGSGNAGAVAIDYLTSNIGILRNLAINGSGGGHTGIRMNRSWPGPGLIKNVSITGFRHAMTLDFHYQYGMTLEHVAISGQTVAGILTRNNPLFIRGLTSNNSVPAIHVTGDHALIVLKDSSLAGPSNANTAIVTQGKAFVCNTHVAGYSAAINDTSTGNRDLAMTGSSFTISQYVSPGVEKEWVANPDLSLKLPVEETPTYADGAPGTWANGLTYGMTRNGNTDNDKVALQAAMNSGAPTVYLPRGQFYIDGTVTIPATVKHVIGANTILDQRGVNFNNAAAPLPVFQIVGTTSDPLIMENIWLGGSFGAGTISVQHASTRPLALVSCAINPLSSKNSYINTVNGGKVFFEDVMASRIRITNQSFWGRQLNAEFGTTAQLENVGGKVWLLGYKTEGQMVATKTTSGGFTEVLGGFFYPNDGNVASTGAALHEVSDSHFSGSWVTNQYQYSRQVVESRSGVTNTLYESEVPTRGSTENVPLYVGYTATAGTSLNPVADAYVWDLNPTTAYGELTTMVTKDTSAGYRRRSFMRFDLESVTGTASTAQLTVRVVGIDSTITASAPAIVNVYSVTDDAWSETGLSWSNQPPAGTLLGTFTISSTGDQTINIATHVNSQLAGDRKLSICLMSQTGQNKMVTFASREGDAKPRLVLQ